MPNKITEEKVEAGSDILAYCGKCKEDSDHTISSTDNDKIYKVLCKTCSALHNYRKPKGAEVGAVKTAKGKKAASSKKSLTKSVKKWNELLADYDLNNAQEYSMKQNQEEAALINHSSFGVGVVMRKIDQNKIEVQFENEIKLLAINRG